MGQILAATAATEAKMFKHFAIMVLAVSAGIVVAKMFGGSFNLGSLIPGTTTVSS